MKNREWFDIGVGFAIGFLLGAMILGFITTMEMRTQAVARGHAEYYMDTVRGPQWRWK